MFNSLSLDDLLAYTSWEREKWHDCLRKHGASALEISAGPHGDGRFASVGDLVRHIFTAEKRYVERITGRTLTDFAAVPNNDIETLFQFSRESRKELQELIATYPEQGWDEVREFHLLGYFLRATPRKIVIHVLTHEIRHWAQIATLLRLNGMVDDFHDFLASPVMGGEFRPETGTELASAAQASKAK